VAIEVRFKKERVTKGAVRYEEVSVPGIPDRIGKIYFRKFALETAFEGWPEELHVTVKTPIQK
jgi:hypothetical protein